MKPVSLISDTIMQVGGVPISNTVLASLLVTLILLVFAAIIRPGFGIIPSKMQLVCETLVLVYLKPLQESLSDRRAKFLLPYFVTLFFFIFLCNQFAFIPLVSSAVVEAANGNGLLSVFRTPTSSWGLTLALALITVIGTQIVAFCVHPWRHITSYIRVQKFFSIRSPMDLLSAGVDLFLGLLELVSEVAKVISLSARLFGNVFAGEVMVIIISGLFGLLTAYVVPIPFIILGTFSGVLQAYLFSYLSMLFMSTVVAHAEGQHA